MTVKSIISIDVDDGAFTRFKSIFDKYEQQLAKMPGAWAQVTKTIDGSKKTFDEIVAAMIAKNVQVQLYAEAQKKADAATSSSARSWRDMARSTRDVAGNVTKATRELLKWSALTGVFTGLLGAGGLFGIDRMAASVAAGRRSSLGLGVGYGQQQAFGINFGRFVDPGGFLGRVADAKSDWSKRWAFSALGVDQKSINNRDPSELGAEILGKAKTSFDRGDQSQQYAQAHGLLEFFSMEDLRRLHNMSKEELAAAQGGFRKDRRALDLDAGTQRAWTDFAAQMSRAGQGIENTFVRGLVKLKDPLEHLSIGFEKAVEAFAKSPAVEKWIAGAATGLEKFAGYIGTPEFEKNVQGLVSGLGDLVSAVGSAVKWFGTKFGGAAGEAAQSTLDALEHPPGYNGHIKLFGHDTDIPGVEQWFGGGSAQAATATGAVGAPGVEGRRDRDAYAPASFAGAAGASGSMADTIREAAKKYGIDPEVALRVYAGEGKAGYVGDDNSSFGPFQLHYGGVSQKFPHPGLGDQFTKDTGLDARDQSTAKEQVNWVLAYAKLHQSWKDWSSMRGHENEGFGPARSPQASAPPPYHQRVEVQVSNATGGSAITTVSQLAH